VEDPSSFLRGIFMDIKCPSKTAGNSAAVCWEPEKGLPWFLWTRECAP